MISRSALSALAAISVLLAVGCTRVVVHKDPDDCNKGIRYYRLKPYLFIAPAGGGAGATFSISQDKPLEIKTASSDNLVQLPDIATVSFDEVLLAPDDPSIAAAHDASAGHDHDHTHYHLHAHKVQVPHEHEHVHKTPEPSGPQPPKAISIQLQYLPDFSEEYAIQLEPGLGIGELNIQLQNGWNLTSVGIKTDQQTDEIIKSVAELVGSVGGLAGPSKTGPTRLSPKPIADSVYATNVPFGFYEAVIATDPCGHKQLYGWRYVGFMPFQCCPTRACGMDQICCNTDCDAVYGLVWFDGILQFARIGEIPKDPIVHAQSE